MINPKLIEHIFKAASISRWNDYPKMVSLVELDKQSHKAIIAYFLTKLEKDVDINFIIDGLIFEFFMRIVVTDIRPDVFHQIQKTKKDLIKDWILNKLTEIFSEDSEIFINLQNFIKDKKHQKEKLILKAASYLATKWEFEIIYQTSKFLNDIEEVKKAVYEEIEDYYDLNGVRKISLNQKLAKIIDLSGRLRFQKRWAQTPRLPETSVLGHMFIVAIFSYFFSKNVKACKKRLEFNFFCALFHDFPESLTRDIITPVKYGIAGLDEIINDYEMLLIDKKILPNIPADFVDEFSYILGIRKQDEKILKNEFENRILENEPCGVSASLATFNEDKFRPIDGKVIKFCDKIAAYFEAGISISYGVKTKELIQAFKNMDENFKKNPKIEGIDFYEICKNFVDFFELKEILKTP